MTSQSGGGGGIKGVTSDGLTPGGEIIAGALTAGDPNAASVPSTIQLNGRSQFFDSPGNSVDVDEVVRVQKQYDSPYPALNVFDSSGNSHPIAKFGNLDDTQLQVDGDGVQVHGKFKTGASVAHVLGAYSGNAVPIYNEAGTLLGYMPLYA